MAAEVEFEAEHALEVLKEFLVEEAPDKVEETVQEMAGYILEKALEWSPFGTGWFMSSWKLSREPPTGASPKIKFEEEEEAKKFAKSRSVDTKLVRLGIPFYLSNNAPHATFVEYGSPTTVPRNIVQRIMDAVKVRIGGSV